MRTREDGMGDDSVQTSEWMISRFEPKIIMARACQTCPQVCVHLFTDFHAESWNLLELGKECEHDWVYERATQSDDLVSDLLWRGREATAFPEERETQTEYKRMTVKKDMEANESGVWWDYKMKTRCLTCKAQADDTSVEETRMNHIAKKNAQRRCKSKCVEEDDGRRQAELAVNRLRSLQEVYRRRRSNGQR